MPDIFISDEGKNLPKSEIQKERLTGHTHNPLASYCYYPDNVNFENREEEETIILLLRKHPVTNIGWISLGILMFFAPIVLSKFPVLSFLPTRFQFVAILGWYLITFAFLLEKFLVWFYDIFIITNERVLDIDFYNLIYKEVTDASLEKIQDVTYTMGGVGRAIFNFGDVIIQTAAELENLKFEAVPWPDKIAKILQDIRMQEHREEI